jgi:hypothetical protein
MRILKSKKEYIDSPNRCPVVTCNSNVVEAGSVRIEGTIAVQDVWCMACDAEWTDKFTLTGYKITN